MMAKRRAKAEKAQAIQDEAQQALRTEEPDPGKVTWPLAPEPAVNGATAVFRYWTESGKRYRVAMLSDRIDKEVAPCYGAEHFVPENGRGQARWDTCEKDPNRTGNYAKHYRTLNAALEAAERFHRERHNVARLESNREAVIHAAMQNGLLAKVSPTNDAAPAAGDAEMATATMTEGAYKIGEKKARRLFQAMGYASAEKWPMGKLQKNLLDIGKMVSGASKEPEGKDADLLKRVSDAVQDGCEILVTGGEEAPAEKVTSNGHGKPDRKAKATKVERSKPSGTDRFGNRCGSKFAAFNAALSEEPMTMKELMDKADLSDTVYNHAKKLMDSGFVTRDADNRYKLTRKGMNA